MLIFHSKIYKKYEQIILYLFFGGLSMVVNFAIYFLVRNFFNWNYQASNILAWLFAVLFAFVTNKYFVFKSRHKNAKQNLTELFSFLISRLLTLVIDISLMFIFISYLKYNDFLAKAITQITVVLLNYLFSKVFIFTTNKPKSSNMNK